MLYHATRLLVWIDEAESVSVVPCKRLLVWIDEAESVSVVPCNKIIGVREKGAESRVCLDKTIYRVKVAGVGKHLYCSYII